jgi:hypothetical protein
MKFILSLSLLMMIIFIGIVDAWTQETSVYVARQVLIEKYPACALQIEQGVKDVYARESVDEFLGEPLNFHCDTMQCLAFSPVYCKMQDKSCPSESKAGNVKTNAQKLCNCEQAKELAESITYFIAKYNPMNVMVNESESCRNEFNEMVENNMKKDEWSDEIQCDAPNMKFTFDKRRFNDIINSANSFAYGNAFSGTNPWFCYNLVEEEGYNESLELKENGDLCVSDVECESEYCNNRVCCAEGICCPNPNMKGHPCLQGQICNENYMCEYLQLNNGEECEYNEECSSGNCAYNMLNSDAYCTYPDEMYGCGTDDDCVGNYECIEYSCKYIPVEEEEKEEKEETNNNGICLILPLILLGGLFVWKLN